MQVVGVAGDGSIAFREPLGHGEDPAVLSGRLGYLVQRPLAAVLEPSGDLALRLCVQPAAGDAILPRSRSRGQDRGLRAGQEPPARRQRVAAYALVLSDRGLLATEFSDRTAVRGQWGLPGGGIDPGEQPAAAVLREIVEETGQLVDLGELTEVQTSHWLGRAPSGGLEDFHAVRLVYEGQCPAPTDPVVGDVGGTTASARWVPLPAWQSLRWTAGWYEIVRRRLS